MAVKTRQLSGQSLLFGPRRGRSLDPKVARDRRSEITRRAREQAKQNRIDDYIDNLDKGLINFLDGDGALLAETLREPAGHGLKGIEKREVHKIVKTLDRVFWDISRRSNKTAKPMANHKDLEASIIIADRCRERKITIDWKADRLAGLYFEIAANDLIRADMQGGALAIGPLPRLIDGDDFQTHVARGDGRALCANAEEYQYAHYVEQFDHSPASARLECDDCLTLYKKDHSKAEMLSPARWSNNLDLLNHNNWSEEEVCADLSINFNRDPSLTAAERSQDMIEEYYQAMRKSSNELLLPFTDYRLS